ncbi:zinc finger, CCHC-type containing protein [Tanacetum coccineum]
MFEKPPAVEIYDLVDTLHSCKQAPGKSPNPKKRKENPNKDQACHHCHMTGHWKRNCPLYLEELRANKKKSEHSAAGSVGEDCDLEDDHKITLPSENTSEIPVEPESLGTRVLHRNNS